MLSPSPQASNNFMGTYSIDLGPERHTFNTRCGLPCRAATLIDIKPDSQPFRQILKQLFYVTISTALTF